ncbi:hypothetical protein QBC35DRAFT_395933, partial [Podospora australis]
HETGVLLSAHPPSIEFFKTLPRPPSEKSVRGIYAVVMEKAECPTRSYIGSGTRIIWAGNVSGRLTEYHQYKNLPSRISSSMTEGYTITHQGLLYWQEMPTAPARIPIRSLMSEGGRP